MKGFYAAVLIFILACNSGDKKPAKEDKTEKKDSIIQNDRPPDSSVTTKTYSNERFRNVKLERIGENKFRLKGQAQIFEASFSWVVEDGHNEIKSGFEMTDAGAPEWGNFDFTIEVDKKDPSSTLHLILFEVSARDGSRVYELPILLY